MRSACPPPALLSRSTRSTQHATGLPDLADLPFLFNTGTSTRTHARTYTAVPVPVRSAVSLRVVHDGPSHGHNAASFCTTSLEHTRHTTHATSRLSYLAHHVSSALRLSYISMSRRPFPSLTQQPFVRSHTIVPQEFAKKHPGGRIVNFYLGKNATEAFEEFHVRSTKAKKWLKSMKSRPDNGVSKLDETKEDPLVKDFTVLRQELVKEGFFDPNIPHVIYRISEILLMHFAGFYMVLNGW